jgi:soluble lytic murein transglycosylase-like protein
MPMMAVLMGTAFQAEHSYSLQNAPAEVLEETLPAFQGNSPFLVGGKVSPAVLKESMTLGRLIARRMNPAEWSREAIDDLSLFITLKSRQHKISPFLVLSVIHVESSFRTTAVSPKGAIGLMQLMPATAAELAESLGLPYTGPSALEDPKLNIELGVRYIKYLQRRFPSKEHVLTAYNMGPGALERRLRNGQSLSFSYYQKVMEAMEVYTREAGVQVSLGENSNTWL